MPKLKKITSYWFLLDCFCIIDLKNLQKLIQRSMKNDAFHIDEATGKLRIFGFSFFDLSSRYQILTNNFSFVSLSFVCLFISHNKDLVVNSITYDYVLLGEIPFWQGILRRVCLCALFFSLLMHSSLWVYVYETKFSNEKKKLRCDTYCVSLCDFFLYWMIACSIL